MAEGGRMWRTWQLLAGVGVAFLLGIGAGATTAEKDETVAATGQASTTRATLSHVQVTPPSSAAALTPPPTIATTTIATTTTAPGPKTTFGDGSYRVGIDIAAGTYRSSATATSCYWKRMSNFTGTDDIIANYLSNSPTTVTILASDAGFQTRGCGTWTKT